MQSNLKPSFSEKDEAKALSGIETSKWTVKPKPLRANDKRNPQGVITKPKSIGISCSCAVEPWEECEHTLT